MGSIVTRVALLGWIWVSIGVIIFKKTVQLTNTF